MTVKVQATKEKIDKLDFMKIKNLCAPKPTISSEKATYRMWKNTGKSYLYDSELISRNCRESLNTQQKINNLIQKWTKELNRHFCKENIWMAHKHMKGG